MTIEATVSTALGTVMDNAWAVELPSNPFWPAIVWDIDTQTEDQWCQGGGYDQHTVAVSILSPDKDQILTIKPNVRAAFEALNEFMYEDASGDADYEDDPNVYGYFITFRLRSPRY